jgi:putative tricarboxylic transport membrane protein
VLPDLATLVRCIPSYLRASFLGFFVGALPGTGAALASFLSYGLEKAVSKEPGKFGTGVIEGVAGPETADNAAAGGAMVPMFTLGIPSGAASAVLLAALMMLGLRPGPLLIAEHSDFFWAVVASMYIGNVILLIINLPMAPLLAQCLRAPYPYLYTTVLGVYSINNSMWDVGLALAMGVVGYFMNKLDYPAAPLVLGLVIGPMLERTLRQTLTLSRGDLGIFFSRPIAATLLVVCAAFVLVPILRTVRRRHYDRQSHMEGVPA